MSRPLRNPVSLAVAAALAACSACAPSALAATPTIAPLPSSDYATRPACAPPAPEQASCLAMQLLAVTAEARRHRRPIGGARPASIHPTTGAPASGDYGYRPRDLHNAYSLPDTSEAPQTIALVDAYN
ncbi:MAG TPA: hypothetical protein VL977_05510, partial [Solirubrobacteraceae bacterium]|nr:hypothetical protein [Solirubrobacteraceae bacterium]